MKHVLLTLVLAAVPAAAAEAQVKLDYTKKTRYGTFRFSLGGGHYSGYGYGYGYGSFGPGFVGQVGGGTLRFGVRHRLSTDYGYSGYGGYGYSYGTAGNSHTFYSGPVYPGAYGYGHRYYGGGLVRPYGTMRRTSAESAPYPHPRAPRAAGRPTTPQLTVIKEISEGTRLFKAGNYPGALNEFREAVLAHTESGSAQVHFAIALTVAGDSLNAEKALRRAAKQAPLPRIDSNDLFKHARERDRILKRVAKQKNALPLPLAYLRFVSGDDQALKKLAEKDAAAAALLKSE